jgi:hypothetical protein
MDVTCVAQPRDSWTQVPLPGSPIGSRRGPPWRIGEVADQAGREHEHARNQHHDQVDRFRRGSGTDTSRVSPPTTNIEPAVRRVS